LGPHRGRKAFTLQSLPSAAATDSTDRVAQCAGFSLHAGVAAGDTQREKLERLCRTISRPAVAIERWSRLPDGRIRYALNSLLAVIRDTAACGRSRSTLPALPAKSFIPPFVRVRQSSPLVNRSSGYSSRCRCISFSSIGASSSASHGRKFGGMSGLIRKSCL
jgi:hypothetical protein